MNSAQKQPPDTPSKNNPPIKLRITMTTTESSISVTSRNPPSMMKVISIRPTLQVLWSLRDLFLCRERCRRSKGVRRLRR